MKYLVIGLAIGTAAAFAYDASAQSTAVSGSASNSNSTSASQADISNNNSTSGSWSGSESTSGSASNAQGNEQNINFNSPGTVNYKGSYKVKDTPAVSLGQVFPTSPCMGGTQVGGSGPGIGLSIGTSWKDDDCSLRETARSFQGLGMNSDAVAILCSSSYAKAAPICGGKAVAPVAVVTPPPVQPQPTVVVQPNPVVVPVVSVPTKKDEPPTKHKEEYMKWKAEQN